MKNQNLCSSLSIKVKKGIKCHYQVALFAIILNDVQYIKIYKNHINI